jgi:hypothetical protein
LKVIDVATTLTPTVTTDAMIAYEIVRRTLEGTVILNSTETTNLEPGDLVRLRTLREYEQRQPNALPATKVTEGE